MLLARLLDCNYTDMRECWNHARNSGDCDPWTTIEVEAGDEHGIPYPSKLQGSSRASVCGHNDQFVVMGWNANQYFSVGGHIDRLDVESGEIMPLASVPDIWGVATDPRDGRIFCVTCYDGIDLLLMQGSSVLEPNRGSGVQPLILAQAGGYLGWGVAFDVALGAVVSRSHRNGCFYVISPQENEMLSQLCSLEGAVVVDALRPPADDCTPGDRSQPWVCLQIQQESEPCMKADSSSCSGSMEFEWACTFISVHGGVATYLEPSERYEVRTIGLLGDHSRDETVRSEAKLSAIAGIIEEGQPLFLIAKAS